MPWVVMKYASQFNDPENPSDVEITRFSAYDGYSCRLACVQAGKVFDNIETPEAKDYLDALRSVNPTVDFGFVKITADLQVHPLEKAQ